MSGSERPHAAPGDGDGDGPHRDDMPPAEMMQPGDIDLTGAIEMREDLVDVIRDSILEANASDTGELPEWGARTVARYLASYLQGAAPTALHQLAATNHVDYEALYKELSDLYPIAPPINVRGWIDRLGTYLIARQRAGEAEATQQHYRPETQAVIKDLGAPYAAFLKLPDVTEDTDLHVFHASYFQSFATHDEIAQHVGETHEVWRLLDDASLSHLASPDPALLMKLARTAYDIVHHNGRYFLFYK